MGYTRHAGSRDDTQQPVLPWFRRLRARYTNRSRRVGDRVLFAWPDAAEYRRKRPSSNITQIAPLRVMGLEKIAVRSCRMMSIGARL